jgi:hypothetical protein
VRTRTRNAIALCLIAVVLAAGLVFVRRKAPDARTGALSAVPAGALLVATVDLGALRASPVGAPFFQKGREIPGIGKVRDVCGFDPVDTVHEIALAIPAAGEGDDFGLVAAGTIDDEALLACASKVIETRGGRPIVTGTGSFRIVRDATMPAGGGEIAVRRGGPLLLGAGAYLRAMIDAAEGRAATIASSAAHARLAREVGPGAAQVTVVLTPEQRRELASELRATSPGKPPPAASIAAGALGVVLGERIGLHGVLVCDAAEPCVDVASSLKAARDERAADFATRLVGFGALLEQVRIEAHGEVVHARVDVPGAEAAVLLDRLLALRSFRHPMPPPESDLDAGAPSPPSDASGDAGEGPAASAGDRKDRDDRRDRADRAAKPDATTLPAVRDSAPAPPGDKRPRP